jgi:SAM-dependent methyltransferase
MKELLDRLEATVDRLVERMSKKRVYISETEKIRSRVMEFINKDMAGVDIGCGNDKLFDTTIGIDGREIPGVDVVADVTCLDTIFGVEKFEYVYSSHCLEHVKHPFDVLKQWVGLLRDNGIVVLYLPHKDYYLVYNPEHLHTFEQKDIEEMLEDLKCDIACSEMDLGHDRYSFLIVGRKR